MKRLFIAIKLIPDDNLLGTYYSLKQAFRYDKIRWVNPDNFHITLKFLGNTSEDKIDVISEVINNTVKPFSMFKIDFDSTGVFGSRYKPRVIWFGIKDNEQLKRLGVELINNIDDSGIPKDRQNFVPHLTIGRITKIVDKHTFNNKIKEVKDVFLQQTTIDRVVLFESILSSTGSRYNEICSFSLKKNEQ